MRILPNLKIGTLALLLFTGCQKLKPDSVQIPEYPDYAELMTSQAELLGNGKATKKVSLKGKNETHVLNMDSAKWVKELSFLKEINPNQPEYVGAFVKSGDELNQTLNLAEGENGPLKRTTFSIGDAGYEKVIAIFHEDKDVYIHHREIELNFADGLLRSFQIEGYQKMMFKDTVRFSVEVTVD
ncbi:hypothetical protein [Ekhidna sp. To15]|uniref:hypothetical protein n=1 Tax=Ekhidna sp. To15 TaxID=3395267 RepID=UPI003F51AF94